MSDSAGELDTSSNRRLRRRSRVEYSEDEIEEEPKSHSKEKKRGAKRKAEINVESLYCQENVKEVCPTSLETIFESPQKGQNRGRTKSSTSVKNAFEKASSEQVMSVKKWKRFCSFSDYYNPSKQKTKVRKDRAKKLKQITGVKIPKGKISDSALQTVLSILSEDEDWIENIENIRENTSSGSFYVGNIIRPDTEDTSINDVIKDISSMQMTTESCDENEVIPKAFMEDFDGPLLFSGDNENRQPRPSHQKKSRRRSEKFSGSLLPPSFKRIEENEAIGVEIGDIGESTSPSIPGERKRNEEQIEMNEAKVTPKRPNSLSDKKVVKKTKIYDFTLKRESDSKDEHCQKKRGNVKVSLGESSNVQEFEEEQDVETDHKKKDHSFRGIADQTRDVKYKSPDPQNVINSSLSQVAIGSVKGKRRGKRRVSGIQRPLYRTILAPPSPEVVDNENHSPNCLNVSIPLHERNVNNLSAVDTPLTSVSPGRDTIVSGLFTTSPCTQMAALSLQSEREMDNNAISHSIVKEVVHNKKTRRRSRLSANPPKLPLSVSSSQASKEVTTDAIDSCQMPEASEKVRKRTGKRLSNVFSQFCVTPEVKSTSTVNGIVKSDQWKDSKCSQTFQKCDAVLPDEQNTGQLHLLKTNGAVNSSVELEGPKDTVASVKDIQDFGTNTGNPMSQLSIQNLGNSLSTKVRSFDILEEQPCGSPFITGMIDNKARVQFGNIFHNKKAV